MRSSPLGSSQSLGGNQMSVTYSVITEAYTRRCGTPGKGLVLPRAIKEGFPVVKTVELDLQKEAASQQM